MPVDKFIISKAGFFIVDEHGNPLLDASNNPLTFLTKEAAQTFIKNNKIVGKVK